jgi:hypothetical protein
LECATVSIAAGPSPHERPDLRLSIAKPPSDFVARPIRSTAMFVTEEIHGFEIHCNSGCNRHALDGL